MHSRRFKNNSLLALRASIAFLLASCGGKSASDEYSNPDTPTERIPEETSDFTEERCAKDGDSTYVSQCGVVTVPLAADSDETLELAVVRIFSNSPAPKPDPVIYLDGGPGAATLVNLPFLHEAFLALFPDRDLIFFDQRGVGRSAPELSCASRGDVLTVLDRCYRRLSDEVDLNAYRSINSAHDVAAIVRALGYDQANLFGISYGTRLALTVMREHPEVVRSAIIDSVVPLQVDLFAETGLNGYNAMLTLFSACAEDTSCRAKYPDPMTQLVTVVSELDQSPVEIEGYPIDGLTLVSVIFQMMYSSSLLPYVPFMIDSIAGGDMSLLESMFGYTSDDSGFAFGQHLSLQCAEEVAFSNSDAFAQRDALIDPALRPALSAAVYLDYCEHWPVTPAPPIENQAVQSDLPTLVLAGKFDPITPPIFSMAAHDYLSRGQYFQLDAESHGASVSGCGARLVDAFINAPAEIVDGSCTLVAPGLEFQRLQGVARGTRVAGKVEWQIDEPDAAEVEEAISKAKLRRRIVPR